MWLIFILFLPYFPLLLCRTSHPYSPLLFYKDTGLFYPSFFCKVFRVLGCICMCIPIMLGIYIYMHTVCKWRHFNQPSVHISLKLCLVTMPPHCTLPGCVVLPCLTIPLNAFQTYPVLLLVSRVSSYLKTRGYKLTMAQ